MIDFKFIFRSTLGISSVIGGPFAGFSVQCDPTGVARHGSIPGVLSYAIMADALSARDDRGQTLTARSPVAGSQDRSLIFVYFKIRLRA